MDRRLLWEELGYRPALFPAVAFAAGCACIAERPTWAALFLAAAGLLTGCVFLRKGQPGTHLALLAAFFFAGAGLSTLHGRVVVPAGLAEGGRARLEATVDEVAETALARRLVLSVSRVDDDAARFKARVFAKVGSAALYPGQRVLLEAKLKSIAPALNPGQADFKDRLRREGVLFTGGYDAERLVALSPPSPFARWLAQTQTALAARVRARAPSPEAAALYLTLAAGLRAELGEGLEEEFSASGLAHVLSVSGLHVAVLALALLWGLRALLVRCWRGARRIDVRRVAAPLAVPLVWAYVLFTGNQLPAVRSAVMATAVLVGMALWRRTDALNALAVAAIALLAFDPSCIANLSTQLSFLAVLSLVVLAPAVRAALPVPHPAADSRRRLRFLVLRGLDSALATFCASVAVTLCTAPLIASVFHRFGVAGLVSNVVCMPLCAALTLLAAGGAAIFVVFPPAAEPVFSLGTWGSEALLHAVRFFAALPGASLPSPSWGTAPAVLFVASLFAWALLRGRTRALGLFAPGCALLVFAAPAVASPRGGLVVTFLSVGQGDAIVLASAGHAAIVDGGGSPKGADTGERYVLPFLREARIDRFELAVLSHPHPDHALGLASTLRKVPTSRLWLPEGDEGGELTALVRAAAASSSATIETVQAGHPSFVLGEAIVEVLGPPADRVLLEGVNDRSIVLRVRHRDVTFLLTGDLEEAGEEALGVGPSTVVKVAHHGSRTSSGQAFIDRVRPKVAVFCVGRNNRFGFPHPEVEDRWRQAGAECFRTDLHGAVRVESDGLDVRVVPFLSPEAPAQDADLAPLAVDHHP